MKAKNDKKLPIMMQFSIRIIV